VQSNATTLSGAGYEPGPTVTSTPSRPCSTGVTCAGSNRASGTASAARRCCDSAQRCTAYRMRVEQVDVRPVVVSSDHPRRSARRRTDWL